MIKEEIRGIINRVVEEKGAEVYWIDLKPSLIRVYVEKLGGVTVKDCEEITKQLSLRLRSLLNYPFTLEVSSPGVERMLHKPEDFERFIDSRVNIITKKESITGRIERVTSEGVRIEDRGFIPFKEIKRASIKITDEELFRRRNG